MRLEYKSARFKVKDLEDSGHFEGYASVFGNEDMGGDIVMPGAFRDSLKAHKKADTMPAMLWQHDHHEPIGVWEQMSEDDRGLRVKGRLLIDDDPVARRAHAHLKAKSISGMSIGYATKEHEIDKDVRRLTKVDLWETSIVTFPMNVEARVDRVKARECFNNIRDFEAGLRDVLGFSQSEAKTLAGGGWWALYRDGDESAAEALELVERLLR